MATRRGFVASVLAAPAVLRGAANRNWAEIERLISSGNASGRLHRDELPTPSLLVDLDILDQNIARMASHLKQHSRAFRPHAKTHKCPQIALRCMKAGAVGACAAKISEAEALAAGGVTNLLLTTSMIGKWRIERALRLARKRPETIFIADNAANASELNDAARAAGIKLNVAVDLLVSGRTGITPGEPAAGLARQISKLANLKFYGIQAYAGHSSHVTGFEKRRQSSQEAMGKAVETRRLIEASGLECPWLSGGSTGTYNIDTAVGGITEIQPGSFLFMDIDYNRIGGQGSEVYRDFGNSLTVLATVISKPADDFAIVDAGFKAFSTDRSFGPELMDAQGISYSWAGDEHGRLDLKKTSRKVNLGDRLQFIVPHCDPTVNLYDRVFAMRKDSVEAIWRITARGATA
jgi:D-serine deaminase-like pyridoxal phosphate-dependent protein